MRNSFLFAFAIAASSAAAFSPLFAASDACPTLQPATFEDLPLPGPDSFWMGYDDPDYMMGEFRSGDFEFNNLYIADWDSWAFFGYSNSTHTGFSNSSMLEDQFNSAAGCGACGSETFCVGYVADFMGRSFITPIFSDEPESIPGLWITNSAWTAFAVHNGDGFTDDSAFGEGDWYKVVFTALDADDEPTSSVDFFLADYRSPNPADRYCLDTWQWVDLSPLGKPCRIQVTVEGNKENAYGLSTPSYMCIDNVGSGCPAVAAPAPVVVPAEGATFPIDTYFSRLHEEATVDYFLLNPSEKVSLDGEMLTVSPLENAECSLSVIVGATECGETQYVEIPVEMATGVKSASGIPSSLRYDHSRQQLTPYFSGVVSIYSLAGVCVARIHTEAGCPIGLHFLHSGLYVARGSDGSCCRIYLN